MHLSRQRALSRSLIVVVILLLVAASVGALAYYDYGAPKKPTSPLLIYSADLYTVESGSLYSEFANQTGLPYAAPKGAGSFALARQIAQGSPVSVFISVSKAALEEAFLGNQFPGWGIAFASDQMSIGYATAEGQSTGFHKVLTDYQTASASNASADWKTFFTDLTSGLVKVGIGNPNNDPAGYRAWIVLEAAGKVYAGDQSFFVSRLLQAQANLTGQSASALVAPLQAGQIQFLFMYKSAVVAHSLTPMVLPRHVNLGDSALGAFYSQFSYPVSGGIQSGGPIQLFITVPKESHLTTYSLQFVVYVVQHSSSMSYYGLVPLTPAHLYNSTEVPSAIAQLLTQGSVVGSGDL